MLQASGFLSRGKTCEGGRCVGDVCTPEGTLKLQMSKWKIYQIIGAGKRSRIAGGVGISPGNKDFLTFMPPRKGDFKILKPVLEKQNILNILVLNFKKAFLKS